MEHEDLYQRQVQQDHREYANSLLEHKCNIELDLAPRSIRMTNIICTIGPSCRDVQTLKKMITEGMNIARLNFSYGTHAYHKETIENLREAVSQLHHQRPVAIALDTKGPEIRTGLLAGGVNSEVKLKSGKMIKISIDDEYYDKGTTECIWVDYRNIVNILHPGNKVFIDDGLISLVVKEVGEDHLICEIENGGKLGSCKGCFLPGSVVDLSTVTEKDKQDLIFGIDQDVDIVFASCVSSANTVRQIKEILGERGRHIRIISKIENLEGVKKFNEILAVSDGIMVVRAKLGLEIPLEKVFLAQKMMISRCNRDEKSSICATQMLESMAKKPLPTRAETSDVANAVLDGADCVMLSGETAKGNYPLEALKIMNKICSEAESAELHSRLFEDLRLVTQNPNDPSHTVAIAAVEASFKLKTSAIIVITTTGRSAYLIAAYRPRCPVLAITRHHRTAKQSHLCRGVFPIYYTGIYRVDADEHIDEWTVDVDRRIYKGIQVGLDQGFIRVGDQIVVVSGWKPGAGSTNTMRVIEATDPRGPSPLPPITGISSVPSFNVLEGVNDGEERIEFF